MEKAGDQVGVTGEAVAAAADPLAKSSECVRAEVCHRGPLQPRPQPLDGIELGGIGGKPMDREPGAVGFEVSPRLKTAVRVEAIPKEDHAASDVAAEMLEEADDLARADGAGVKLEVDASLDCPVSSGPAIRQRTDRGELFPAPPAMGQDRRLAPGRPRPTDGRALREPAFVEEDDRRALACGVFFIRGQVSCTQCRMACSSRSRARVVGFCKDQPIFRISFHTCPEW